MFTRNEENETEIEESSKSSHPTKACIMLGNIVKRITVGHKLTIISLAFSLPIAVLLYFYVSTINANIRFGSLEEMGNKYQRPLEKLLDSLGRHQLLAMRQKDGQAGLDAQLQSASNDINKAFTALEAIDKSVGTDLQFTDAGLGGKRKREHATVAKVKAKWDDVLRGLAKLPADESDKQHAAVIADVRTMITHAGDTSNLILDPDLDSYYLMDCTLLALPQTQDRLTSIISNGLRALKDEKLTQEQRILLAVDASLLKQSDLDRVVTGTNTALTEDENFYGVSDTLKTKLEPQLREYDTKTNEFIELLKAAAESETKTTTPDEFLKVGLLARDASFTLWNTSVEELDKLLAIRIAKYARDRTWALALTAAALLVSLVLVFFVARSITVPIHRCMAGMQSLAARDLTTQLPTSWNGELGRMALAVNQAVGGVREAIDSMRSNSGVLTHASEDMTSASHVMSANAEETAVQSNVVAAAAEQVSRSVQTVATASEEMATSIREVARQAHQAARVAIDGVTMADSANASVVKLGEGSKNIGNVVKVITTIAEQTNLLALNATIEAARAGEVGRGFAVVANEVKELAKQTAHATDEIGQRIAAIQTDIDATVKTIDEVSGVIKQMSSIQTAIASAVEQQTVVTKEIGRNLVEAARGTSEIARNIAGVAEAARNTSQGAHKTERTSTDLARAAKQLGELVGHFKCE